MAFTTIKKSSDFFNTKLYTGTGSSNAITGVGFQPDLVWLKNRDTANSHQLYDAVRGTTKYLESDNDGTEYTSANGISAFGTDGFTINGNLTGANNSSDNFASWNWKAGTTSGITTNGSSTITPTGYSFNTTNGFSIIKYDGNNTAGAGLPHGLGVAPSMVIVKRVGSSGSWITFHKDLGGTKNLILDGSNAVATESSFWNNTAPDATNIYFGTSGATNVSGAYVAYCWTDVIGFSKFGTYTGNGSTNGPFIYTGFKPAVVMIKKSSANDGWWQMQDDKRDVDNPAEKALFANVNDAEYSGSNYYVDYFSNGFKCRSTNAGTNSSGGTYIYMAFAAEPLIGDNPATAR